MDSSYIKSTELLNRENQKLKLENIAKLLIKFELQELRNQAIHSNNLSINSFDQLH